MSLEYGQVDEAGLFEQPLYADLSVNDMAEFRPKAGDTLRVCLPPERLRVFAA